MTSANVREEERFNLALLIVVALGLGLIAGAFLARHDLIRRLDAMRAATPDAPVPEAQPVPIEQYREGAATE